MNEIIKKIKDAVYRIPIEPNIDPYSYQQGLVDARFQALDIIEKHQQNNCHHVFGKSSGDCLKCGFEA